MWKLLIRIDVAAVGVRYQKFQEYLDQIEELCEDRQGDTQWTSQNILHTIEIIQRDNPRENKLEIKRTGKI